jgi:hypothetical protein
MVMSDGVQECHRFPAGFTTHCGFLEQDEHDGSGFEQTAQALVAQSVRPLASSIRPAIQRIRTPLCWQPHLDRPRTQGLTSGGFIAAISSLIKNPFVS